MSQARIIDGKAFAAKVREDVAAQVAALKAQGVTPGLAVVLVGEDPASQVYVRNKGEQTLAAGMHSVTHRLSEDTSQEDLLALVATLNDDPAIHGILAEDRGQAVAGSVSSLGTTPRESPADPERPSRRSG